MAAQSIKIIGNTAIPLVKLKTLIMSNSALDSNSSNNYYKNNTNNNNNINNNNNYNNTAIINTETPPSHPVPSPHPAPSTGPILSLDISFEGPGHYGLEANKLTIALIKVMASHSLVFFYYF